MTLQVEKEFKLEAFINNIICDQLKRLIYGKNVSAYLKFLTLPQYIEFLGACVDEKDFIDETQSKVRFNKMMNSYFKNVNIKYSLYNDTHIKWYLYKDFRCGIVHQLRPQNKIGLTVRIEASSAENIHLEPDKESGEYLVLILEDMYDDIEKVAKQIILDYKQNKFNQTIKDKWDKSHMTVFCDGGE